ncbi:acylphosphatase [Cryptosporidium bovis]|uniref:acylphosphatase n=1 Tax=Cryptosporidium bovis TaxID=310047 RepID=UPI003519DA55|nr:acylphosphatase [Cryptosporidium bovis]
MHDIQRCKFEVFGKVQGVYFRKYTSNKANELGVFGWCSNTPEDTVVGELEGPRNKIQEMIRFLENEGSPNSVIEKCIVSNLQSTGHLGSDNSAGGGRTNETLNPFDMNKVIVLSIFKCSFGPSTF